MCIEQISVGNRENRRRLLIPNYLGTSNQCTTKKFDSGALLANYPREFWIFKTPQLAHFPGDDGHLISPMDAEDDFSPETDLLPLRTGYEKYSGTHRHWEINPRFAKYTWPSSFRYGSWQPLHSHWLLGKHGVIIFIQTSEHTVHLPSNKFRKNHFVQKS